MLRFPAVIGMKVMEDVPYIVGLHKWLGTDLDDAACGDQNNPDLYGKQLAGKALCLPQTIGSTTGGLVLYCACAMGRQPGCMLFSGPVDSLAAAGSILASVWLDDVNMPVIDSLGQEFLDYVKDGMTNTALSDGTVCVDG